MCQFDISGIELGNEEKRIQVAHREQILLQSNE